MNKKIFTSICVCLLGTIFANAQSEKMTRDEAEVIRNEIIDEWRQEQGAKLKVNMDSSRIVLDTLVMKYEVQVFGEEPIDGRSLWISMHGGGNAPKELNDSQWLNQLFLYQPEEGIYLCPRAPWDDWDMWFKAPIDGMFEELIRTMMAQHNVNPDKVYILGYSAGGDGIWRLAPRLADHWAAASMMAGHPGDVRLENVRNLPFSIWVGSEDAAYNRNVEVAKRGVELDSLRSLDKEGYIHETHIVEGKPHWMDQVDTLAVAWMAQFKRNPYPSKIVWRQEEVLKNAFYWIEAPEEEIERGKTVIVEAKDNKIDIQRCDYTHLIIYLNDQIVDLDKKVTIVFEGKKIFMGMVDRDEEALTYSLDKRQDPAYCFPAIMDMKLR